MGKLDELLTSKKKKKTKNVDLSLESIAQQDQTSPVPSNVVVSKKSDEWDEEDAPEAAPDLVAQLTRPALSSLADQKNSKGDSHHSSWAVKKSDKDDDKNSPDSEVKQHTSEDAKERDTNDNETIGGGFSSPTPPPTQETKALYVPPWERESCRSTYGASTTTSSSYQRRKPKVDDYFPSLAELSTSSTSKVGPGVGNGKPRPTSGGPSISASQSARGKAYPQERAEEHASEVEVTKEERPNNVTLSLWPPKKIASFSLPVKDDKASAAKYEGKEKRGRRDARESDLISPSLMVKV